MTNWTNVSHNDFTCAANVSYIFRLFKLYLYLTALYSYHVCVIVSFCCICKSLLWYHQQTHLKINSFIIRTFIITVERTSIRMMRVFISQYNKRILVLSVVSYPQVSIKFKVRVTSKCQATWLSFYLVHASYHNVKISKSYGL